MIRPLAVALCLLTLPALAADPSYSWKDSAGNTLTLTVKPVVPAAPLPVSPKVDALTDGAVFTLPKGTSKDFAWIRQNNQTLQGDPDGSTVLDCQNALAGGRSCITNTVGDVASTINVSNMAIINGYDAPTSKSQGTGCIRFYGTQRTVNLTNLVLANCSDGIHGEVLVWNLKNISITSAANHTDGLSHAMYIGNDVCDSITIDDSTFNTMLPNPKFPPPATKTFGTAGNGGHQLKLGCKVNTIRNTTITDSTLINSGAAINLQNGGDLNLENVTIRQGKTTGNKAIIVTGAPCKYGAGNWHFKNVTIIDDAGNGNLNLLCGAPKIMLEGTNVIPSYLKIANSP